MGALRAHIAVVKTSSRLTDGKCKSQACSKNAKNSVAIAVNTSLIPGRSSINGVYTNTARLIQIRLAFHVYISA